MKRQILGGATSTILEVFIQDSSKGDGSGLTGLLYNASGLTCYYKRTNGTASVSVTLATITTFGTFATGGLKEIDATNMPGMYEFHPPDAALASGAKSVAFLLKGATNMAPLPLEVELTATDNQDGVRAGMTALPNAAAEASGGLYTRGTGAGQIRQDANGRVDVNAKAWLDGTIPAVNVTGVPKVDVVDWVGVSVGAQRFKKNAAVRFAIVMFDTSGNPKPSAASMTCKRSLDGGAEATAGATITEVANGTYDIQAVAADLNADSVMLRFSATGCKDTFVPIVTEP